jgi:hypothetical protein
MRLHSLTENSGPRIRVQYSSRSRDGGAQFVCSRLQGGDIVNSKEGVVVLAKADLGSLEPLARCSCGR